MTQEIEDGNFTISKFMGYTYPDINNEAFKLSYEDLHCYHKDWNLLMPVVEKISLFHYGWEKIEDRYDDCAYPRTFGMRDKEGLYMVRINGCQLFSAATLIEATWLSVIDFIKDFNSIKTNPNER